MVVVAAAATKAGLLGKVPALVEGSPVPVDSSLCHCVTSVTSRVRACVRACQWWRRGVWVRGNLYETNDALVMFIEISQLPRGNPRCCTSATKQGMTRAEAFRDRRNLLHGYIIRRVAVTVYNASICRLADDAGP